MATLQDEFDVPDPSDWQGTPLASLELVEQSLRCHVCKDFFESPMITSCNHSFCSLCIRRCLSADGKCPLCRGNEQESKLRGNWALREAVEAFVRARDGLIKFARTPVPAATSDSPKRKATELDGSDAGYGQETKRLRTSARLNKGKGAEITAAIMLEEAEDPVDSGNDPIYEPEPDDGLVACPICLKRMKDWQVDKHLDTSCPGSPQPQPPTATTSRNFSRAPPAQFSSVPEKAPERIPSLPYGMMKEGQLRKKMSELGIPNHGTKQQMEKRHQEWVTIWNANCDSTHPKKRSELLNDLDVWERTIGSRAPVSSKAAVVGAQIKDKDFDGAAWAAKHDTSFKDLIANARRTRMQAQQKAKESSQSETVSGSHEDNKAEPELNSEPQPSSNIGPRLGSQPQTTGTQSHETSQPSAPQPTTQVNSQSLPVHSSQPQANAPLGPGDFGNQFDRSGANQDHQPSSSQPTQSISQYQSLPQQSPAEYPRTPSSQPTTIPSVSSAYSSHIPSTTYERSREELGRMGDTNRTPHFGGYNGHHGQQQSQQPQRYMSHNDPYYSAPHFQEPQNPYYDFSYLPTGPRYPPTGPRNPPTGPRYP